MDNQQPSFRVYISSDGIRFYIGCQSNSDPAYLGSFSDKSFKPIYKFVVGHFHTREEAGAFEDSLIVEFNAIKDPLFVNRARVPVKSIEDCRNYSLNTYASKPELKVVLSNKSKGLWNDPEYLEKQVVAKERLSKRMTELWKDPDFRKSQADKISKSLKNSSARKSEKYLEAVAIGQKKGSEGSKKFFEKLKADPEKYSEFMERRGKTISEAKQRKKVQRLSDKPTGSE